MKGFLSKQRHNVIVHHFCIFRTGRKMAFSRHDWYWINPRSLWVSSQILLRHGFCVRFLAKFRVILTHWGRDKMTVIFQTTFSNTFCWMKMLKLRLRFHWNLFPRVQLAIFGQATSHCLKQWWLVYWRIYASLGLNELMWKCTNMQV